MSVLRMLVVLALVFAAGCVSVRRTDVPRTFEFPFVNDYAVVNRVEFPWSDAFLAHRGDVYSQDLAGPLSALAASVYGYHLEMDVQSLRALGFDPSRLYRRYGADLDYEDPVYGNNLVGFTLAVKRVPLEGGVRDIVFVVVRGTFGRDEWLSNMNPCNTWGAAERPDPVDIPPLHEGFRLAADTVENAFAAFVASNRVDLSRAKVVVTGHSRGAAVANILGARFDDYAEGPRTTALGALRRENVHVYTFATPNTVLRGDVEVASERYGNIFNIVNPEDVVPRVPIDSWNCSRYGRTLRLLDFDTLSLWGVWWNGAYNEMKSSFREMTGYEWWHMPFGTNATCAVPALLGAVAPSLPELYAVPPGQRKAGRGTSVHSILEFAIYRAMDDPHEERREASLGDEVASLASAYSTVEGPQGDDGGFFYMPDGRDFSRQPGGFDILWRITCMHATQTYIGWMKAAEKYGPEAVYVNW